MFDGVTVIGGGLAGSEAAWQLGSRGVATRLYEMRPVKSTGAHKTGRLAELVCSNSFKSNLPYSSSGELKREMRVLGSLVLDSAAAAAVPAGEALAVDREVFSDQIEQRLAACPSLEIIRDEVPAIPTEGIVIVATGPLTSELLAEDIARVTGSDRLFFYDAVAPIVETESIDFDHCWEGSRYDKGEAAYLNCPLDQVEYDAIVDAIIGSELVPVHDFEDPKFFEGCLPLEEIAKRGRQTLAHGPWKPVGLHDPITGIRPCAVLQLRRENAAGTCYSLVACQSRMTWPEQRRIFAMIPALAKAVWLRLGVVHRNTYLDSPRLLDTALRLRMRPSLFFAGQITGVEGYLESAATGLITGINACRLHTQSEDPFIPHSHSMLGALMQYVSSSDSSPFAPLNANFGLLPPVEGKKKRKEERRAVQCERALQAFSASALEAGMDVHTEAPTMSESSSV
ncbi:MAG: methylenetetrahydrofolate--tRNA-(uracil(54)-C(5))-methyltransferase (FADH(2)-oxidizing) TrmFO [Armatimonadota bacterium]